MSVYVCTTTHFIIINKAKWFLQFFGEVIFILFPIRGGAIVGDEPAQPGHRVYKQTSLRSLWCTCSLPSRSTEHGRLARVKGRLVCSYLANIGGKSWARGWGFGGGGLSAIFKLSYNFQKGRILLAYALLSVRLSYLSMVLFRKLVSLTFLLSSSAIACIYSQFIRI